MCHSALGCCAYIEGRIDGMREGFGIAKEHADARIVNDNAKVTWDAARQELRAAIRRVSR
jgi:hypothetical protein